MLALSSLLLCSCGGPAALSLIDEARKRHDAQAAAAARANAQSRRDYSEARARGTDPSAAMRKFQIP